MDNILLWHCLNDELNISSNISLNECIDYNI